MADTSTGWFLTAPIIGDGLDGFIHDVLTGVSGIDGAYVIPAFNGVLPIVPDEKTNWIAYQIEDMRPDFNPSIQVGHYMRNDSIGVTIFVYGPLSGEIIRAILQGFSIKQNLDSLYSNGLVFQYLDIQPRQITELFNNIWFKRWTATVRFGRHVDETGYGILGFDDTQIQRVDLTPTLTSSE